jgi:hypothetical protein
MEVRGILGTQESAPNIQTTQEWESEIEKALGTQLQSTQTTQEWEMEVEKALGTQLQVPSAQISQELERGIKNALGTELQIPSTQITQEPEETPSQSTTSTGKKRGPGRPPKNQILPETARGSQDIRQSLWNTNAKQQRLTPTPDL